MTSLHSVFETTVRTHGDRTSLVGDGLRLTWSDVAEVVDACVAERRRSGIGPGDAVALILPNGPAFVIEFLAVTRLGATVIPLNPQLTATELVAHLDGCGVRTIVATADGSETASAVADAVGAWWTIGADAVGSATALTPGNDAASPTPDPRVPVPGDRALIAFSSGSTGSPKRIPRTHANLSSESRHLVDALDLTPDDVILATVPLFHAHGLGNAMLAALCSGAALVTLPRFERGATLAALVDEGVTVLPAVPFMLDALASSRAVRETALPRLRCVFTAGGPLDEATFDAFLAATGVAPRQLYGCSEMGSVAMNLDADPSATRASVGLPFPGVRVAVADDAGETCGPGETGEILIAGPSCTAGYLAAPPVNAESFRGGWFVTGDLGRLDEAGRLYVTGRKKLYIATGGHKVDPVEVERVIEADPHVREAIVVGVPGPRGTETVKAVVVPANEHLDRDMVLARCRSELAPFKVPRVVELRDEIPRSPLGKVLRKYLVEPLDPLAQRGASSGRTGGRGAVDG